MTALRDNAKATATNVLIGLREGRPMTESAAETMPNLVSWLRSLDLADLASDIEVAFSEYVAK